jgi:hypothetical protein
LEQHDELLESEICQLLHLEIWGQTGRSLNFCHQKSGSVPSVPPFFPPVFPDPNT